MEDLEDLYSSDDSGDAMIKHSIGYIDEIPAMLQAFGDVSPASPESVLLIDKFVYLQMTLLLRQAAIIAEQRNSREIGIEEFMFLCRKNKRRLFHFMRHMHFRDSKYKVQSSADTKNKTLIRNISVDAKLKRSKACMDFINCIDCMCDLKTSFYEGKFDDIRLQRLQVAEVVTRNMTMKQYEAFCSSRQISYSQNKKKFSEWLRPVLDTQKVQLSKFGWESLTYFAYETVAELVHLALLVKSEQYATTKHSHSSAFESLLLDYTAHTKIPTTTEHINEALRRCFGQLENSFAATSFSNSNVSSFSCAQSILVLL